MSGFHCIPKDSGGHEAAPVTGTCRTEDGQPADLLRSACPITAACATCGGPIRLEHRLQYGWRHVPAPVAPAGGTA
jgi:hypothetical protein